jgi:hypothetical protein
MKLLSAKWERGYFCSVGERRNIVINIDCERLHFSFVFSSAPEATLLPVMTFIALVGGRVKQNLELYVEKKMAEIPCVRL